MTVKVTKPAVNVREKLSELDSPILDRLSEAGDGLSLQGDLTTSGKLKTFDNGGVGGSNYSQLVVEQTSESANASLSLTSKFTNVNNTDKEVAAIKLGTITNGDSTPDADISFETIDNGSLAERMRIDSSGNVGIGKEPSYAKLEVSEGTGTTPSETTSGNTVALFQNNDTTADIACISVIGGTSGQSVLQFGDADDENRGMIQYDHASDYMVLRTNGSGEDIRIDSSGNFWLQTVGTNNVFQIGSTTQGRVNGTSIGGISYSSNSSNSGTLDVGSVDAAPDQINFYSSSGFAGKIASSGTTTSYGTSSDYRLKENVTSMTGATERLKQLNPVRFNFIADADTTVDGFLAHEVSDHVPEAITGTKDEVNENGDAIYQCIDQSKLVPLLVATIKELEARIAALEETP